MAEEQAAPDSSACACPGRDFGNRGSPREGRRRRQESSLGPIKQSPKKQSRSLEAQDLDRDIVGAAALFRQLDQGAASLGWLHSGDRLLQLMIVHQTP
jgi:hypothetical protein